MEGSLRVPFIIRWPGKVEAGRTSDDIVHVTDLYATLAALGNAEVPKDRIVDGIDQRPFFLGQKKSLREGFCFFLKNEMYAVKWRNWKYHIYWQPEVNEMKGKLESPYLFNLLRDPKEQVNVSAHNAWVWGPVRKMMHEMQQSFIKHPNTPPGQPDA